MSIATKCMVVDLSMGMWEGRKLDRAASDRVNTVAKAKAGTARVTKRIIPDDAFDALVTARNALKAHFRNHTLPWKKNGEALLMRNMFDRFMDQYGLLEKNFNDAADEFVYKFYPPARESAAFNMGDLFNPDDYPAPDTLRHRFYVTLNYEPVPIADDFRVQLDEAQVEAIKAQMEETLNQRLSNAMKDVWLRLIKVLEHYIEKTSDPKAVFRDSTVKNIIDLVDTLPGLNVVGDPNLRSIRRRLAETLYQVEPEALRTDADARAQAAKDAQDILDDMRGFLASV